MKKLLFCILALYCVGFVVAQKAQKKAFYAFSQTHCGDFACNIQPKNIVWWAGFHRILPQTAIRHTSSWVYPGLYFPTSNKAGISATIACQCLCGRKQGIFLHSPENMGVFILHWRSPTSSTRWIKQMVL